MMIFISRYLRKNLIQRYFFLFEILKKGPIPLRIIQLPSISKWIIRVVFKPILCFFFFVVIYNSLILFLSLPLFCHGINFFILIYTFCLWKYFTTVAQTAFLVMWLFISSVVIWIFSLPSARAFHHVSSSSDYFSESIASLVSLKRG